MPSFGTVEDLPPEQRLLVRLDLNAPVEEGVVKDNRRFSRHAETVERLLDDGHALALLAHQGRPGRDTFVSLGQHAEILADHLDREVEFVADTFGEEALEAIDDLAGGEVLLLENVRMCDEELPEKTPEEHAESEFVRTLAPEFDAYVNDAYSAAHRAHASIVGFPLVMDAYAGPVMETEYTANSAIREREFDRVTMVLGGTKAEDLIPVIERLEGVDRFCLGGIVGELFLRAAGHDVGYDVESDLFDDQWDENREEIKETLETHGDRLVLASDLAYEDDAGERAEVAVDGVEKETSFLDVGSDTVATYADHVSESDAVFVKGALGVFEDERFSDGTVGVLRAIADTDCFSVVGGGDTSRAIPMYDLPEDAFSHVSIAGGAYVAALTGEELVAIEVLERDG
ncbi:phosphoglycerate kinase [Saliphagus infecundisoli]|uniref:Phosphoglycerate kinase n=1 Tax=Saliphagus infecundisoli TaxID=1849069 RepID=A0ABD5QFV8_9EURY|nr:phosphoglycerate kinase [Saliphagus infecundisoli]